MVNAKPQAAELETTRNVMYRHCLVIVSLLLSIPSVRAQQDLNDQLEQTMKAAAARVAPAVVQVITQGGADMVVSGPKGPVFRKALGPTTGLIVSADGYVVSSAFNFVNNPAVILVSVPGHEKPYVATRIATDRSRMITLLKIEADKLPVPVAVPRKELQVGQWAIALGRTLDPKRDFKLVGAPSVSVGIISAVDRVWGRAVQTDAKVSPLNYGGPLIDIQGRVQGVLVPASPQGEGETAGFEWYDSGIGFAIPLDDINAILPRLKQGKDLHKGILGIRLKSPDIYGAAPVLGEVTGDSSAAKAGLKTGDVIVELDGKPVVRMAQIMHLLGPKYEGDKISLKYKRDDKVIAVKDLVLVSSLKEYAHPFLGILPMRDDPKLGVEVRFVYPKSAAERAGLKAGDRIVKLGLGETPLQPFSGQKSGRDELSDALGMLTPGSVIKLEVVRDKKTETLTVTLDPMPGTVTDEIIPSKLPEIASRKQALAPLEIGKPKGKPPMKLKPRKEGKDKTPDPKADAAKDQGANSEAKAQAPKGQPKENAPVGILKRALADGNKYWLYVPEDYDPNISYAVVLWLHPPGKHKNDDLENFIDVWEDYCKDEHIILVLPVSDKESGWVPGDSDFIREAMRDVLQHYTVDRQRVVAHGMGVGGQMALYMGFHDRDLIRGVATTGAVATQIKENRANQRLSFYISGGERDPLIKSVAESKTKLAERKFPVFYRLIPNRGREYFEAPVLRELVFWIDCLDRL
jgi:S1-C subfamily serine protease/predicted esterase